MTWNDGTQVAGPELAQALIRAGPADPRVVLLAKTSGEIDSVAAGSVRGIEAPRIKLATTHGLVVGFGLDVTVYLWFRAWANAWANLCSER